MEDVAFLESLIALTTCLIVVNKNTWQKQRRKVFLAHGSKVQSITSGNPVSPNLRQLVTCICIQEVENYDYWPAAGFFIFVQLMTQAPEMILIPFRVNLCISVKLIKITSPKHCHNPHNVTISHRNAHRFVSRISLDLVKSMIIISNLTPWPSCYNQL